MIQLALYKGKGLIGNAVTRFWTASQYSHCELVIDGICYSASFMDGGVRAKEIDLNSGKWDLIPAPWVDQAAVLEFYERTKGKGYDWFGIFGAQLVNRRIQNPNRFYCSEWCGAAPGLPTPEIHSPYSLGMLFRFMSQNNRIGSM